MVIRHTRRLYITQQANLSNWLEYGPAMIEHIILEANLDPNMKVSTDFDTSETSPMLQALLSGFEKGNEMIESSKNVVSKGYIVLLDEKQKPKTENGEDVEMWVKSNELLIIRKVRLTVYFF